MELPYADDIGVGKTYKQGYDGPDLLHYVYVDSDELNASWGFYARSCSCFKSHRRPSHVELDVQNVPSEWNR